MVQDGLWGNRAEILNLCGNDSVEGLGSGLGPGSVPIWVQNAYSRSLSVKVLKNVWFRMVFGATEQKFSTCVGMIL